MKRRWVVFVGILLVAGFAYLSIDKFVHQGTTGGTEYTTSAIVKGEVLNTITSTGTLEPLSTVAVGTQVSGIIKKLHADFNDVVKEGQLIAELDRTFLLGALDEAVASRMRAKALYDLAKGEVSRNEPLFKKGFISEQEFDKLRTDYLTQEAALHSAEASVKKANINLQYATIASPISGTVIERTIEEGQTVAANFSAPTLFTIAEDLRKMRIRASVDEADIGSIKNGQEVRFSVQAFPERIFNGTVEQVRLQPTVTQNVVTYTVVIGTENIDGSLLPGMTATVDFIVEKASEVVMVSNAALRFKPSGFVPGAPMPKPESGNKNVPDRIHSLNASRAPVVRRPRPGDEMRKTDDEGTVIWMLGNENTVKPLYVKTGITDGKYTEIISCKKCSEGTEVITGFKTADKKKKKSVSLLPQPGTPGRRR